MNPRQTTYRLDPRALGSTERGFSLIELAVVLILILVLVGMGLGSLTGLANLRARATTDEHIKTVQNALNAYLASQKRLPCPGVVTIGSAPDGQSQPNCSIYSGIVPFAELGLSRSEVEDGWGNFLSYVVTAPNANSVPADKWTFDPASITGLRDRTHVTGRLTLFDSPGASSPSVSDGAYALISHGPNGLGAWTEQGTRNGPPPASSAEECANAISPPGCPASGGRFYAQGGAASGFDDVVVVISARALIQSMIAIGALQPPELLWRRLGQDFRSTCPNAPSGLSPGGFPLTVSSADCASLPPLGAVGTVIPLHVGDPSPSSASFCLVERTPALAVALASPTELAPAQAYCE